MNNFEIEIKLPVEQLEGIKEKLLWMGFHKEATIREFDMYYNSEYHDVKNWERHFGSERVWTFPVAGYRRRSILKGRRSIRYPCPGRNMKRRWKIRSAWSRF